MKGSVHAAVGASAPIGLVLTQRATILQGAVMAAVSAGYSLLPDIDCKNATVDRALGGYFHKPVYELCARVYQASGTSKDLRSVRWMMIRKWSFPYHRTLTHTLLATLALGVSVYGLALVNPALAAFVAAFGVFLLWPLRRKTIGQVVCGAAVVAVGAAVLLNPWLLSLAVAGGYLTHIVGDACTKHGVPLFWPLQIKGKRWWNIRLLESLVASGSTQERGPAVGVSLAANALLVFLQF